MISEEEGRRHRIAFNSLYLFSSKSINYKANGETLYNFTRGGPISSSLSGGLRVLPVFPRLYAQKHPGGVASMTRDRGYPDWLVLSARLLAQPSCGQVGGAKYICLIVFSCGYVKILQPVAICSYFRNTVDVPVVGQSRRKLPGPNFVPSPALAVAAYLYCRSAPLFCGHITGRAAASPGGRSGIWPHCPMASPSLPGSEFVCNLLCHCI